MKTVATHYSKIVWKIDSNISREQIQPIKKGGQIIVIKKKEAEMLYPRKKTREFAFL